MSKRKGLCPACQKEEMARASACYEGEAAAKAKGESYKCTCGPLPCDEGGSPHKGEGSGA